MILTSHDREVIEGMRQSRKTRGKDYAITGRRAKEAGMNPETIRSRVSRIMSANTAISYEAALDKAIAMGGNKRPRKH